MAKQAQYTLEEAKARAAEVGDEWTPELESRLRAAGKINDAAPAPGMGLLKEIGLAAGEFLGGAVPGLATTGGSIPYAAAQRAATGSSVGEQTTAGIMGGLTAGGLGREALGAPDPATGLQRGANVAGTGVGMTGAFMPLARGGGIVAGKVIPQVAEQGTTLALREAAARRLLGSGLAFGTYDAAHPGTPAERVSGAARGLQTGMIIGGVPQLPGVSRLAATKVGRPAVDASTFVALGASEGAPLKENVLDTATMLGAAAVTHKILGPGGQPAKKAGREAPRTPAEREAAVAAELAAMEKAEAGRAVNVEKMKQDRLALEAQRGHKQAEAEAARRAELDKIQTEAKAQEEALMAARRAEAEKAAAEQRAKAEAEAAAMREAEAARAAEAEKAARIAAIAERELARMENPPEILGPRGERINSGRQERPATRLDMAPPPEAVVSPVAEQYPRIIVPPRGAPGAQMPPPREAGQAFDVRGWPEATAGREAPRRTRGVEEAVPPPEAALTMQERRALTGNELPPGQAPAWDVPEIPVNVRWRDGQPRIPDSTGRIVPPGYRPRRGDVTLGTGLGGAQPALEAAGRAGKRGWKELKKAVTEDVRSGGAGGRDADVFTAYLRGDKGVQDLEGITAALARRPRGKRDLPVANDAMSAEQKARINEQVASALAPEMSPELVRQVRAGELKDASPAFVNKGIQFMDRKRVIQTLGGKEQGSPLEVAISRNNEAADMARYKLTDAEVARADDIYKRNGISTRGKDNNAVGDLAILYEARGGADNWSAFFRTPEAQAILSKTKDPVGVMRTLRDVRAELDRDHTLLYRASEALTGEGVGDIPGYFPKEAAPPKWYDLVEKYKRAAATENVRGADNTGVTRRDRVMNPRRLKRSSTDPNVVEMNEREVPRDNDAYKILRTYKARMASTVTGDAAMANNLEVARYLEAAGLPNMAKAIRTTTAQAYNTEMHGLAAGIDKNVPVILRVMASKNKQMFDQAKYRLNPVFNAMRQPQSVLPYAAAHLPAAVKAATVDFVNPEAWRATLSTFTARTKLNDHARMHQQVEREIVNVDPKSRAVKMANFAMDALAEGVERFSMAYTGMVAKNVASGMKNADGTPWSNQKVMQYVSDVQGKTQSFFDNANRAGILNSRMIQGNVPAQGYGVEAVNMVLEDLGITGVDLGYSSPRKVANAMAVVGAIIGGNLFIGHTTYGAMQKAKDDRNWWWGAVEDGLGWLPGAGMVTGEGPGKGQILPAAQGQNFLKMLDYAEKGDWAEVYRRAATYTIPGGAFTGSAITGRLPFVGDNLNLRDGAGEWDAPQQLGPVRPVTQQRYKVAPPPAQRRPRPTGGQN